MCSADRCVGICREPIESGQHEREPERLHEAEGCGCLSDRLKTKFDNRKAASAEFGKDWSFIKSDCESKFIEAFNDKSKGIQLQKGAKGAKYKFVLTVTNVDDHVNVMGYGPRTEAKFWGKLKIVEAPKGKVIAEINIEEAEDGVDYVRKEALGKTFALLAKRLAKIK